MAYICAFLMSLVAATASATLKYIATDISVEFITFCQFFICFAISVAVLLKNKVSVREITNIKKADISVFVVRGLSGLLGFYCFYLSVKNISLVDATLLRHSSPFFVPLISLIWLKQHTKIQTLAIVVIGFIGVYITLQPAVSVVNVYHMAGIFSALFLAMSMVTTHYLKSYPSSIVLFYYFLISVIGMFPIAYSHWVMPTLFQALCILYIGTSIYIAMFLYNKAFTLEAASHIAPMTYLSIVHAGWMGWLIWGHTPSAISIVGMLIVVACGIVTSIRKA